LSVTGKSDNQRVRLFTNKQPGVVTGLVLLAVLAGLQPLSSSPQTEARYFHAPPTGQGSLPQKPKPAPARFRGLIGEYGPPNNIFIILENEGNLSAVYNEVNFGGLKEDSKNSFTFIEGKHAGQRLVFFRDLSGRATRLEFAGISFPRHQIEPETGNQLRITPVRPVAELMKEALAAQPPVENGDFLPADLVELTKLDPTIRLEVRYATTNNFLGTRFYSQAARVHAASAAEAVVRTNRKLKRSAMVCWSTTLTGRGT
jgi:hypothetical protein